MINNIQIGKEKEIFTKDCENHCPKCDSDDINWGMKDINDAVIFQDGTCNKCGCEFREFYTYCETEWMD